MESKILKNITARTSNRLKFQMMVLSLLICLNSCNGQKNAIPKIIGLGLLTANTQYPILLYKNTTDKAPYAVLKFETTKSGVTKFITTINLKPYVITGGDSFEEGKKNQNMGLIRFPPELKFQVIEASTASFKIVTNEETAETFVIKRDDKNAYYTTENQLFDNSCSNCPNSKYNPRWYIFETWERYLKRAEFITKENIMIYDAPDGKVIFKNKDNTFLPFQVTEVKGEWIKLKKGFGRESNFDNTKNYNGWTKWREGPNKIIDIIEHTYE